MSKCFCLCLLSLGCGKLEKKGEGSRAMEKRPSRRKQMKNVQHGNESPFFSLGSFFFFSTCAKLLAVESLKSSEKRQVVKRKVTWE